MTAMEGGKTNEKTKKTDLHGTALHLLPVFYGFCGKRCKFCILKCICRYFLYICLDIQLSIKRRTTNYKVTKLCNRLRQYKIPCHFFAVSKSTRSNLFNVVSKRYCIKPCIIKCRLTNLRHAIRNSQNSLNIFTSIHSKIIDFCNCIRNYKFIRIILRYLPKYSFILIINNFPVIFTDKIRTALSYIDIKCTKESSCAQILYTGRNCCLYCITVPKCVIPNRCYRIRNGNICNRSLQKSIISNTS